MQVTKDTTEALRPRRRESTLCSLCLLCVRCDLHFSSGGNYVYDLVCSPGGWRWRRDVFLLLTVLSSAAALAQPGRVITFDELLTRKVQKNVEWVNPDSTREQIEFTQMAIPVDDDMKELTRRFVGDNYGRNSIWVEPRIIVIHSMDLEDLQTSLEQSSFLDRSLPKTWTTMAKAGALPSGAHFIIDRDGKIYCITPPLAVDDGKRISYERNEHRWLVKRHVDALPIALGIENVTASNGSFDDLTEEQITSNARLVRWLLWMERRSIEYVMSHHQFNDNAKFERLTGTFSPSRPVYRATNRQDVGDAVLRRIVADVRRRGWVVKDDF